MTFTLVILLLLSGQVLSFYVALDEKSPQVKLKLNNEAQTSLIGNRKVVVYRNSTSYVYEFLGVPFAQPPVGSLRFRFPQKFVHKEATYDATLARTACWQLADLTFPGFAGSEMWNSVNVSEDCLYLNMWIPVTEAQDLAFQASGNQADAFSSSNSNTKSTMFWIYGGSFNSGGSQLAIYDGTTLAAMEQVIVVSCNYRLGALGFLYLNASEAPGNAGLADQLMALRSYREHYMTLVGGDPARVTVFGESAGAMSINYLMMSADSEQLFSRVIMQSGSAHFEQAYREPSEALYASLSLAQMAKCSGIDFSQLESKSQQQNQPDGPLFLQFYRNNTSSSSSNVSQTSSTKSALECLLEVDAATLTSLQFGITTVNAHLQMQFVPTRDFHGLVAQDPQTFELSKSDKRQVFAGTNADEGTYFLFYYYLNTYFNLSGFFSPLPTLYDNSFVVQRLAEQLKSRTSDSLASSSCTEEHYYQQYVQCLSDVYATNAPPIPMANTEPLLAWKKVAKVLGDVTFVCPAVRFANTVPSSSSSFYYFDVRSASGNPWPEWLGVMHGYEIEYVFGVPFAKWKEFTIADRQVSASMMRMWASFANTGALPPTSQNDSAYFVKISKETVLGREVSATQQDHLRQFNSRFAHCTLHNQITRNMSYKKRLELCESYRANLTMCSLHNNGAINTLVTPRVLFLVELTVLFFFAF